MSTFLQFWDGLELWLVTLPFPLQVVIMLAMGLPLFLACAVLVEKLADVVVSRSRLLVSSRPAETGKEVR